MSDFPTTARVVIIGGGVVGASALYHLAEAGWSDCVLLEKNELTAGSTWHAAGNCPNFSTSWGVMNMQRYSTELYRRIGDLVDYPINYNVSGSIRLAHSKERMMEFERVRGMGIAQGVPMEMMSLSDMTDRYPWLETHDLEGGLWDPYDGDMDPAQITQAFAKGARAKGARVLRFTPATGVRRAGDEWVVSTEKGDIRCEYVVNAAGYYAQRVAEWFKPYGGRHLPMVVMSHQYLLTDEIPELEAWSKEQGHKLPLLRDPDTSYYLRQEKTGLNLGPYERNCKAHWLSAGDPMPDDFSFQLYPDDLDRIEWHIEDAMARVPLLGQAGVNKVINGPIPYTPDGNPLIGPMPGVPNAFEACVFTFGIAQGGGAGKILCDWITEGATEWDVWGLDPRRFTGFADQAYATAKGMEVYGHEYGMHFPHHAWPAGRDQKLSPVHAKVVELGGQMGAFNGWERANWFARPGDDTSEEATQTWARSGPWEPRVRDEVMAVRDGVGVLDLPGFSRFELSGAGAAEWLLGRISGVLPTPGRLNLAYFLDHRGRVVTEMSVMRHGEDAFTLITAAVAQWHDFEWLQRDLPDAVQLVDRTDEVSTLIVTGPQSRALFSAISDADLSLPWLSHQAAKVAGCAAHLARVSFAGELGWEIHAELADIPAIYDAVLAQGATPFGMFALNSMRLEKGYKAWKVDLSSDYTALESGLSRFVKFDKPQEFTGKAALMANTPPRRASVTLKVHANGHDAPYMANVWSGDRIVGEVLSGGYGYRVESSIALAMIEPDMVNAPLDIEIYGVRTRAERSDSPVLWDPANERLRA